MPVRDTGLVLQKLNWAAAFVALAVVGVATFTQPFGRTRNLVSEVTAFAIAVLTLALWAATDRSPAIRARLAGLMPFAWGAMAVTCGWAALTSSGGPFSLLAAMATVGAGNAFSLAVAGTITGVGVLAVGSVGLAFGVPAWEVFFYPLILVFGLLFGRLERGYRLQAEQSAALLAKAEQLRKEQSRSATLDERNRIAREIHDLLAHSLGALGVQIEAAQAVLTDLRDIDRAVELLSQARRMATDGLTETRRALHALRAGTPPLPEALAGLSARSPAPLRGPGELRDDRRAAVTVGGRGPGAHPHGTRVLGQHRQVRPASTGRDPAWLPRRSHCAHRRQPAAGSG